MSQVCGRLLLSVTELICCFSKSSIEQGEYANFATLATSYRQCPESQQQRQNPNLDWLEIRALCIESEIAEAKLGILQAQRMGNIVKKLTESQINSLRGFVAETNGADKGKAKERRRGGKRDKRNDDPDVC